MIDLLKLTQSEIRNMSLECDKVGGINLSQGISKLSLNNYLNEGIIGALKNGFNYYTPFDGLNELKEEIIKKVQGFNKISLIDKELVVTSGATGAFYCACFATLQQGDEVILFEPYYGYHVQTILSVGAKPVFVPLTFPDQAINMNRLNKALTKKTKAIMICTPSNPSGKIFSKSDLELLGKFCSENNLLVYTDEIYEYFTYDNKKHISPSSLKEFKENTITISGFSKTFSITGWRVGYCIVPKKYFKLIGHLSDLIYVCSPSILQYAVAQGLKRIEFEFYENISKNFKNKRDLLCSTLEKIGVPPIFPDGSYYVLSNVSKMKGNSSKEKALEILRQTNVASVPGSSFYNSKTGEDFVRFCFANEDETLEKACQNLLKLKL